ncbi:hypothetical protein HMPREF0454_00297 [Hafnia alvei ATCC 51873]|uniref:DUF1481 domain-containing protein n=1 Tax=Hafnia alvei ATCC 51873 TaxID=1002364 RepID=G9Y182_HAFAL|nr:hypothetical protein HMPREF0454_00297 [Hafnia alvei ATCC 51873]
MIHSLFVKDISRGALTPLLSICKPVAALLFAAGLAVTLSGCSSDTSSPRFTATGYIADQGMMRIWRKDDAKQQPLAIMSVYSPLKGKGTIVSYYAYQDGNLNLVRQTIQGGEKDVLELRLDEKGELSYMQRQIGDRRQLLTSDDIARSQYQSRHMVEISEALRVGNVRLIQGRWENSRFTSCAGETQSLRLEDWQLKWIESRAAHSSLPLGIAWLDAPEGQQLLLVANEDFCNWEPTVDTL